MFDDFLQLQVHTKFHKNLSVLSKVNKDGHTCVEIKYVSLSTHSKDLRLEKPAVVQMVSKVFSLHCLIYVTLFVNTKLDSTYGTIRRAFN
jgi:hypothetical protein